MFAVPGWSISADALEVQTEPKTSGPATEHKPHHANGTVKERSRKRKRGHGSSSAVKVTEENLGDLWRKYIEKKISDHSLPKEEEKAKQSQVHKQSKNGKHDSLGEIDGIDGGSCESFSEGERFTRITAEEASPKKTKKKQPKEDTRDGPGQANGHVDGAEASPRLLEQQGEVKDGKLKYEQRKKEALKKREHRALLQTNGTLPPIRPEAVSSRPTETAPANRAHISKTSEFSETPDIKKEPNVTKSTKLPKAPESPGLSRVTQPPATPIPSTKLTPLQQRMAAKLTSARFRYLNQALYTSPSDQAMRLFADSPQNYTSYHAGFRTQVAVWPQNPVDSFIEDIKARSKVSVPSQKKLWREQRKGKKPKGSEGVATAGVVTIPEGEKVDPLPRSHNGICTVADLGCGDAKLAGSLSPSAKTLSLRLLSFDLAKGDSPNAHLITVADISRLSAAGLKNDTVDVAICCLSLMGTNWVDVVGECARIVRGGGEVWVAEIKSRFARPGVKKKAEVGIGRKKSTAKAKNAVGEEDDEAVALEETEDAGTKGGNDETDVSAFVEVFRKRGLILKGDPDMANKMFVRMRFVMSLAARGDKGGGDRAAEGRTGNAGRGQVYAKTKFVDDDADVDEVDESKVLKPCVYKTR